MADVFEQPEVGIALCRAVKCGAFLWLEGFQDDYIFAPAPNDVIRDQALCFLLSQEEERLGTERLLRAEQANVSIRDRSGHRLAETRVRSFITSRRSRDRRITWGALISYRERARECKRREQDLYKLRKLRKKAAAGSDGLIGEIARLLS